MTVIKCPVCSAEMELSWNIQDLPHFGEAMLISGLCGCGFRHSDTILLSQKSPGRSILSISCADDLDARVIRSSSGTIKIPELGVTIEPGFASECYISNVEGVLERIEGVVQFATNSARNADNIESTKNGEQILANLNLARKGQFPFTIILEDPLGNSSIDSEKAVKSSLTEEEILSLKTGIMVFDV
jgi:zinc finger protein